jgi:drug/metabolite transporter (DMT)-like permease
MIVIQLSILATTFLAGAVDASLLSLLGDVVATPLIAALLFVGPRQDLARPVFVVGLVLSLVGGSLAIVGGHHFAAVPPIGWLAGALMPVAIGLYFILSARASEGAPASAVVGQSIVGAALGMVLLSPWVPGGWPGLLHLTPTTLALVAGNGVVSFFLAPVLYFWAIAREGIVVPAMLMTGIPIFTLILTVGVLGEAAPGIAVLGIPVAVVGAVVSLRTVGRSADDRWAPAGR